ncbi:MAG TPA: hypothetical protein VIW95_08850 [Candidatus Binatus sp.]
MAKKFTEGRCVHCLGYFKNLTSDHVFPDSWYPESTPPGIEKWQAPSCTHCNALNGRNEEDLLVRLGLCVERDHNASLGIERKVMRALDSSQGKNPKDANLRSLKRDKILRELRPANEIAIQTFMPNFGPSKTSGSLSIPIPIEKLRTLGRKLVRGITYVLNDQLLIEADHAIDIHVVNEVGAAVARKLIYQYGGRYDRGPGITIGQARPSEDLQSGIFGIEIWGRVWLHATVVPIWENPFPAGKEKQ